MKLMKLFLFQLISSQMNLRFWHKNVGQMKLHIRIDIFVVDKKERSK